MCLMFVVSGLIWLCLMFVCRFRVGLVVSNVCLSFQGWFGCV